jgi:hypothetical protein
MDLDVNNDFATGKHAMRTTTDGLPYYCKTCGAGWNEYGACEEVDCELEPRDDALARSIPTLPETPMVGNYTFIMEE